MSTQAAYQMKIEAELDLAKAKLAEFRAHAKNGAADLALKSAHITDDLEQKVRETKEKLKELGEAGEDAWSDLKIGVDKAWTELKSGMTEASRHFKK